MMSLIQFALFALLTTFFVIARRREKLKGDPDGAAQMYTVGIVVGVLAMALSGWLAFSELVAATRPPTA